MQKENYVGAINYFTYYINDHPNYYKTLYLRGLSKYNLNDLIGAESDMTKAINCLPELPRLHMVRGVIRSENFKLKKALVDFNKALELDTAYTDVYFYRALTYLSLRNYESALADVSEVIEQDDEYPNIFILRGAIRAQLQSYSEAISDFTICIERNPENGRAYVERGTAHSHMKNTGYAMADFDRALKIDSTNAYAYFHRGLVKMAKMDFEGALVDLNKVIEISPENDLAYFNRALIKSNNNVDGQAIQDFIHILKNNPDNILVFYNLGVSFSQIGYFEEAIRSFNSAIELFPDYADAYYQRALVYKQIGKKQEAIQDIEKFEELQEKNQMKDDSTKYDEGLQILRLTHLSNEFIKEEEKKDKLQYSEIEMKLQPIFQVVLDSVFTTQKPDFYKTNAVEYTLKSIPFYHEDMKEDNSFVRNEILKLDSLIANDQYNMNLYLKRGLFYSSIGQYSIAMGDLNTAVYNKPRNIFALFCRANTRIAMLDSMLNQIDFDFSPSHEINTEALLMYSDILHDLNKILEIDPYFIYARYNIAYSKFLIADYQGALDDFSLIANNRKIAEAHFNKALLQLFLNQKEKACIELGIAGELGLEDAYPALRRFCK